MRNEYIMPGPALLAATAVRTKMPVPMTAPMPSIVRSKALSCRDNDRLAAVARIRSSGFLRSKNIAISPEAMRLGPAGGVGPPANRLTLHWRESGAQVPHVRQAG